MVRVVKDKYSFWLAGYYDDFTNARAIGDDENTPSFSVTYSSLKSHHGNPMNGEALLNPRYRWSIVDREKHSTTLNSVNGVTMDLYSKLKNKGMYEWLSHDTIRNGNSNWGGRAQMQYPNGLTPNRFKYGNGTSNTAYKDTGLGVSDKGYQLMVNGYDTNGLYLLNCGDEDSTFRRSVTEAYHTKTASGTNDITGTKYVNKLAGKHDSWYTSSEPDKNIAMSHLTGIWAGECLSYATGNATNVTPEQLFETIKSPGGKPFLVIKGINNSVGLPSISYDGALNSRLDNDVFHVRLAARCHHGDTAQSNSIRGQTFTNGEYPMLIDFKIGYPASQSPLSSTAAYSGNPAINFRLGLGTQTGNLGGNYAHYKDYDLLGLSGNVTVDQTWLDVDFRIDYTNQKYYVYVNGSIVGNSIGYSLDNTAFGSSVTADELYGYELYHRPEVTSATSSTIGVAYLMLDRVGLVRYLSSPLTNKDRHAETPVTNFKLNMANNAFSTAQIEIFDPADDGLPGTSASNYTYNLNDLFSNTDPVDCELVVFASETEERIDRPIWRGMIDNMRVSQQNKDRKIVLQANHHASLLGKQIPLWDVGQLGATVDEEDPVPYWTAENNGFQSLMNMGTRPLKLLDHKLGFGKKNDFQQNANQRLQLGSGMPIQMYNNEDGHGPNSIEAEYLGYRIKGFQQRVVTAGNAPQTYSNLSSNSGAKLFCIMDGITELADNSANINIVNSNNHNLTNVDILDESKIYAPYYTQYISTDGTYTGDTNANIIYMGVFRPNNLSAEYYAEIARFFDEAHAANWWQQYITAYNTVGASNTTIGISYGDSICFVFDADPKLKVGETFYCNGVNIAGTTNQFYANTNASPCDHLLLRPHTVQQVLTGKDIYTTNRIGTTFANTPTIHYVIVDTTVSNGNFIGDDWEGRYGTIREHSETLTGNNRYKFSKDTGYLALRDGDLAEAYYRPMHARWMRDLPQSLWFKYHFGVVDYYPYGLNPNTGPFGVPGVFANEINNNRFTGVGNVADNYISPGAKTVKIGASLYNELVAKQQWSGVCQIEARGYWNNNSNLDGTGTGPQKYTDSGTQPNTSGRFIYQGLWTDGGSDYRLIGCKYIDKLYSNSDTVTGAGQKFWKDGNAYNYRNEIWVFPLKFNDDYKHLWLLWADMRIDGNADADGGERKTKFGLIQPASEKYKIGLYYLDKLKADGSPDLFTELKINEDLQILDISAIDPLTNAGFSKPVNYGNGTASTHKTVSALGQNSATFGSYATDRLKITTSTTHGITATHVHIFNTNLHDGVYKVLTTNSNTILVDTPYISSDTGATGGMRVVPCSVDTDVRYQDWEDKGGAMCIIDTSPFFNLNTLLNQGGVYKIGGGNTNLTDYEVSTTGFPALLDNYWAEAIASDGNKGKNQGVNPNAYKVISDVTALTHDVNLADAGLRVQNIDIFADSGTGRMQMATNVDGSNDQTINTLYFKWSSRNTTERTSDDSWDNVTLVDSNRKYKLELTNFGGSATHWYELGIQPGMMIINDTTGKKHKITAVGSGATGGYDVDTLTVDRGFSGNETWSNTDDWTIPVQLGGLWTDTSSGNYEESTSENVDQKLATINHNHNMMGGYIGSQHHISVKDGTDTEGDYDWETVTVSSTIWTGANIITRMTMHIDGNVESENIGTFAESDKVRALWNAGLTKNWNPRTRLSSLYDINNIPNTNLMTSDGGTTNNDLYGGVLNIGSGNLLASLKNIQRSAGYGTKNNHHTSFSWLSGRDGRIEFRPKYNSGILFDRTNMKVNNLKTNVSGVVTNVRVYYNDNKNFVDYPKGTISSTTRWKTLEHPSIKLEKEAYRLAQKEYNASRKTNAIISIAPTDTAYEEDSVKTLVDSKLIQTGRYGYIADPYIALQGKADTVKPQSWTRLGTGGSLFTGMSNALDGNLGTNGTIYNRWGKTGYSQNNYDVDDITWANNFYWYGSHSVSHAVQVVHVPNHCPLVSEETGEELRVFITPKENQTNATKIDDAEFCIWIVDYSYTDNTIKEGRISDSGGTHSKTGASRYSRAVVKENGFYELVLPLSYWNNSGSAFSPTRKIIVSFNADYCRDLLRHRCGDPASADIFKSANTLPGITAGTANGNITTGNTDSIFPLGGRMHEEWYMFHGVGSRAIWNAPRIHMVKDVSYTPASFVKVTDAGLGYDNESFIIRDIAWSLSGNGKESLNLTLSLDESMRASNITSFLPSNALFPPIHYPDPPAVYVPPSTPGVESSPPPISGTPPPGFGGGWGWGAGLQSNDNLQGSNNANMLSNGLFSRIRRRMDRFQDSMGLGETRILGADRTATTATTDESVSSSPDGDVSGGNAVDSSNGMTFPGVGMEEDSGTPYFSSSFITTLTSLPNAMSDLLNIVANATNLSSSGGSAVLTVNVTVNGTTYTQNTTIPANTMNEQITLFYQRVEGSDTPNTAIDVEISRTAGSGDDTANYSSVSLSNLGIKQTTSAVSTTNTSSQLSFSQNQVTQ